MYNASHPGHDGNEGVAFYLLFCMMLISGSYLVCLCVRAWSGNLSWWYVNSMNWTMSAGEGILVLES